MSRRKNDPVGVNPLDVTGVQIARLDRFIAAQREILRARQWDTLNAWIDLRAHHCEAKANATALHALQCAYRIIDAMLASDTLVPDDLATLEGK